MQKKEAAIHIGTSGWFYEHWNEAFYPEGLPQHERLNYYSEFFSIVEINTTFYHIPKEETVKNWAKQTPSPFVFAIKANQFITHRKRLLDFEETTPIFFKRINLLKKKKGPILFQLPPSFKKNLERLKEFIMKLPHDALYTFEFRHPTWYDDETYTLLKQNDISLTITDLNGTLSPTEVTAPFVYIRLHGPKKAYKGSYSVQQLKSWREQLLVWADAGISSYCFFDNDEKAYAIKDALRLKKILE
jgi:uncharacterized protein YecE (DUF72 family)